MHARVGAAERRGGHLRCLRRARRVHHGVARWHASLGWVRRWRHACLEHVYLDRHGRRAGRARGGRWARLLMRHMCCLRRRRLGLRRVGRLRHTRRRRQQCRVPRRGGRAGLLTLALALALALALVHEARRPCTLGAGAEAETHGDARGAAQARDALRARDARSRGCRRTRRIGSWHGSDRHVLRRRHGRRRRRRRRRRRQLRRSEAAGGRAAATVAVAANRAAHRSAECSR